MSIHVIQDERDFYEKFTNHLREQTESTFAIHGVPDEDTPQIKDALQERLTAEVINLEHEKLRARGVSDELLDASDLRPTLKELPLPEKERTVLEAKIHRVARQITSREAGGSPEAGTERPPPAQLLEQRSLEPMVHFSHTWQSPDTRADRCICVSTFPGTYNSLSTLIPFPPYPPGRNYVIIACFLAGLPSMNLLSLRVEPSWVGPEGMEVGLASEVQWNREIRAWHLCNETVLSVQQPRPSNTPKYMGLKEGCYGPHTLMFSDGFWNFSYFDDEQFWDVFGGKRLTFYWVEGPFTLPDYWKPPIYTPRAKHSGKVLDVLDRSTANGARLQQWDYWGGTNQQWALQSVGDGYYKIVAKHSGKVLDVDGVSTANGADIQQWDYLGGDNQRWRFDPLDDGHYRIVAKHSGKVLDVRGVSTANGARLQQWDWLGGNNQRWKL